MGDGRRQKQSPSASRLTFNTPHLDIDSMPSGGLLPNLAAVAGQPDTLKLHGEDLSALRRLFPGNKKRGKKPLVRS